MVIDAIKADGTSVFNVDKEGNVTIQEGSTYGLSDRAYAVVLTVKGSSNTANNEVGIQTLTPATTVDVQSYVGSSVSTIVQYAYGFRTTTDLGSFKSFGAPMDLDNFNPRSFVVFVNGIIQSPYENYYFDGSRLYFNALPPTDSKIEIRALAN